MSDRGIQTDVAFIQKPQAVSKAKFLDDNNLVMKLIPHIPKSIKEKKPKFISICN